MDEASPALAHQDPAASEDRRRGGCLGHQEATVLAKPCPTELVSLINPDRAVDGQRNLFCTHYDDCLDEAIRQGWNSWCCTRCGLSSVGPGEADRIDTFATQRRMA
jgi:hypothetical protein